jgi:twitching motility protein PilT
LALAYRRRVSALAALLSKAKGSGAEKLLVAPGETAYAITGDERRPLGGGPVKASMILEAVSELLSHDDIRALSSHRPRILRLEHDGDDYVLEVLRHPTGIALGIRLAARPQARPQPRPRETPRRSDSKPRQSKRLPHAGDREARRATLSSPAEAVPTRPGPEPRPEPKADPIPMPMPMPKGAISFPELDLAIDPADARRHAATARADDPQIAAAPRPVDVGPARVADALRELAADPTEGSPVVPSRPLPGGPARIDPLLRYMVEQQASDLHLSAGNHPVLRIHGEIHFLADRAPLSSSEVLEMMLEIMTDKARQDFETLRDADFAYEISGLARFRVNVFEDRNGTGAVLRQIPIAIIPADKLGLPRACLDLCWLSKGLVVVTGPTGSGKSTTLASMIDFINKNRSDHIITIEDPVEFVHGNIKCLVNQREVGQHTKSFKNALRAALREDPDIVLVGEMRDLETIAIAIETAETGHLVFGTLHTTTAVSTVDRIVDQFPADRQEQIRVMLSESLKGVIAQVLLPKIGGGRIAAHEILIGTTAVSAIIREGKTFQLPSVMQTSKGLGMITLNDTLMQLVQKRLVEPKQAYIKAVDKNGLVSMFKAAGLPTEFK